MGEKLVRKVVLAALKGEAGADGWIKIDAPKASHKEISLAVMEAAEKGLVKACDVSNLRSPYNYPEWRLLGPTGATQQFLRETQVSKKLWVAAVAAAGVIVAFLGWMIPVVISLSHNK